MAEKNNEEMENYEYNEETDDSTEDSGDEDPETLKQRLQELQTEKAKMQESLKRANKEAQKRREKLNELEELGDPEELKKLKEQYEQQQQEQQDKKSEIEKIKEKMKSDYEQRLEEERKQKEQYESSLRKHVVEGEITKALSDHKADTKVFPRFVRDYVQPNFEDGEVNIRVVDDDGDPRVDSNGDYMSINDFVAELKNQPDFQKYFEGVQQGGSGSKSVKEETRGRPKKPQSRSEMSTDDKVNYINQHGYQAYLDLPK